MGERVRLNGRSSQLVAAASRCVGLCDDSANSEPCIYESSEGIEAKILSPKEYDCL